MLMSTKIVVVGPGAFEVDTRHGLYVRLPFVGAGHWYPKVGWTWSWWAELKRCGEV